MRVSTILLVLAGVLGLGALPVGAGPVTLHYAFSADVTNLGPTAGASSIIGSFLTTFDPADVFGVPPNWPNGVINTDVVANVQVNHPDLLNAIDLGRGEHYSDGRKYLLLISQSQVGDVFNHFQGRFVLNDAMEVTGATFLQHLRWQGSTQIDNWYTAGDITVTAVPDSGSTLSLLGGAVAGVMLLRRHVGTSRW